MIGCLLALALEEEDLRMFAPPVGATLPIFADKNSKAHAGATVAVLAPFAEPQHPVTKLVACDRRRRWRNAPLRFDFNTTRPEPNALSWRLPAQPDEQESGRKSYVDWLHDPPSND
jgi:hypothetical protein